MKGPLGKDEVHSHSGVKPYASIEALTHLRDAPEGTGRTQSGNKEKGKPGVETKEGTRVARGC